MLIAGADPGAEGAIAFVDTESMRLLAIVGMPMAGAELLVRDLVLDLAQTLDVRRVGHIFIERQAPFVADKTARIGATTAFNLGQRYMALKAIAACHGWPMEIVGAPKWKAYFGIKADKALALDAAGKLMPEDAGLWQVRRGYCTKAQAIGRAESALLALYGVRQLAGIGQRTPMPGLFAAALDR